MERFFPEEKIVLTGNPVRQDLIDQITSKEKAIQNFQFTDSNKKTLLVLGGSLGSQKINELIWIYLEKLREDVNIIWQTGKLYFDKYYELDGDQVYVTDFLPEMDLAYAAADVIISRAGAGTISELALVGKPVLFIPSPHVAEDHQTKNALAIQDQDAALMIREQELTDNFPMIWKQLITDEKLQKKLSANFSKLAKPNATKDIVNHIEKLLHA
jgi:UDP-N-acetylglucosamine--N-acetylmuramyl-(pentapeptide) pyrophosphoryl-undecaprenol N-acetylglucosamine transferase